MSSARPALPLLLLLVAGCADAGHRVDAPETATLRIVVVDAERMPIAGARVTLADPFVTEVTNAAGVATVPGLRAGYHNVSVIMFGYLEAFADVWIESAGVTTVEVPLEATPRPLLNYYEWTDRGSCNRGPTTPASTPCGTGATATSSGARPRWPKDLYNVTVTVNWTGTLERLEFEVVFGDSHPLADGRLSVNLSGRSPLTFALGAEGVSKAMRRPDSEPRVRAVRPAGPAPAQYDQPFSSIVKAWYRDPSPMAALPRETTLLDANLSFPRQSGAPPVGGAFNVTYLNEITEVRMSLAYVCPVQSAGALVRVFDALGRNYTERFPDRGGTSGSYPVCVPGETLAAVVAGRQVLWDVPGVWRFETGGACDCSLRVHVVRQDWPGMD